MWLKNKIKKMNNYFSQISEIEYQELKDAFAHITLYIAGADGSIDEEETQWAAKVMQIRSYKMTDDMLDFYKEVNNEFDTKLAKFTANLPNDTATRTHSIAQKLSELNSILPKLENKVGAHLYIGYVSFAEHVAKSTGGFFGFFSVGKEESKLLGLEMLTPIKAEVSEEEE